MALNIVLVEPEIPQNTGNIARTCAATGAELHLVRPLGFSLDDRYMRRAGLDYWFLMRYHVYDDLADFFAADYRDGDFLVFGKETRGLPETLLAKEYDRCIRIPMREEARSLNLSNSVAVVLYEALRQLDFPGLSDQGALTGREEPEGAWADYLG